MVFDHGPMVVHCPHLAGKIEPWLSRLLSSGGRLVLSNVFLDSLPLVDMGLFLLQDGIRSKFDTLRSWFYWQCSGKNHIVNWSTFVDPKNVVGLACYARII
jgi:hypothetical protein